MHIFGILGNLSKGVFEGRTSTGSENFFLLICLDTMKFVLLSSFTPVETIKLKILAKPLLGNVKSPLLVGVRRSKTPLLKFPFGEWGGGGR